MIPALIAAAAQVTETVAETLNIEGLISDLAFILILGAATTLLFKWLKQPVVLGYIVAGFLASPHFTYLPSVTTESNIEFWAQIGIIVLLFSLGIEFSFKKLLNAGGSAVVTALIIVSGMMGVGFSIGKVLHFSTINALFLGGMLSMSSTTIIIKAFTDLGLRQRKFASLVFAVLIVEDLFAVVMMVILSSIAINNTVSGSDMLLSISKLVFFLVMWFVVGVFLLPTFLNSVRRFLNNETLLIVAMGLCLGMAVFSVYTGFSLALGAFVMGSILAGTSFAERIEHVVTPVKDLFGSVFFISVGMMVDPVIIVEYAGPILLLSATVIIGMILFGTTGMLITGQTLRVAIESGFSLTQIGEFAFIIATLGMSLGVLDPTIYPIVVAVSVLTTFTTPYFIRLADPCYNVIVKFLPARLHFLIDRYTTAASAESETKRLWHSVLQRYLWRIVLYTFILVAIILVSLKWLLPVLTNFTPEYGRLLTALVSISVMAPFLMALAMPASRAVERRRLMAANARFDLPLILMTLLRMALALLAVMYLLTSLYSWTVGFSFGFAIIVVLLLSLSRRTRTRMRNIESRFIDNLNERELRRSGRNNNLVADIHMAFMTVGYDCPFVGQRLADSQLHSKYGINIASIQRGPRAIPVPGPDTRIFPGDVLGVIGSDDQIQQVLALVEADSSATASPAVNATDYKLETLRVTSSSPLACRTVAQSGLRNRYQALLVSIDRNGEHLQPTAETRIEPDDLLWLVATPETIESLK